MAMQIDYSVGDQTINTLINVAATAVVAYQGIDGVDTNLFLGSSSNVFIEGNDAIYLSANPDDGLVVFSAGGSNYLGIATGSNSAGIIASSDKVLNLVPGDYRGSIGLGNVSMLANDSLDFQVVKTTMSNGFMFPNKVTVGDDLFIHGNAVSRGSFIAMDMSVTKELDTPDVPTASNLVRIGYTMQINARDQLEFMKYGEFYDGTVVYTPVATFGVNDMIYESATRIPSTDVNTISKTIESPRSRFDDLIRNHPGAAIKLLASDILMVKNGGFVNKWGGAKVVTNVPGFSNPVSISAPMFFNTGGPGDGPFVRFTSTSNTVLRLPSFEPSTTGWSVIMVVRRPGGAGVGVPFSFSTSDGNTLHNQFVDNQEIIDTLFSSTTAFSTNDIWLGSSASEWVMYTFVVKKDDTTTDGIYTIYKDDNIVHTTTIVDLFSSYQDPVMTSIYSSLGGWVLHELDENNTASQHLACFSMDVSAFIAFDTPLNDADVSFMLADTYMRVKNNQSSIILQGRPTSMGSYSFTTGNAMRFGSVPSRIATPSHTMTHIPTFRR